MMMVREVAGPSEYKRKKRKKRSGIVEANRMWHLIEDFFEQGVVVKLFIALGWLCVAIMVASFVAALVR